MPQLTAFSYWTFSDIFEETGFNTVPFHDGYGLLSWQGIPKPAYRAFQLLHSLGKRTQALQVPVQGKASLDMCCGCCCCCCDRHKEATNLQARQLTHKLHCSRNSGARQGGWTTAGREGHMLV